MKATCLIRNELDDGFPCFGNSIDGSHQSLKPTEIPRAAWDAWSGILSLLAWISSGASEQIFNPLTVEERLVWKTKSHCSNH